jgi:hypothetical protein
MKSVKFKTLRYNNEFFNDYVVSSDGEIFDTSYEPMRKVMINYPSKRHASPYARANLRQNSGKRRTILVHIAVCDTWNRNSMPVPDGVNIKIWKTTHEDVKSAMRFIFQVNHIDHDQHNHHPSNLEYTTAKQNQDKYQEHRRIKMRI